RFRGAEVHRCRGARSTLNLRTFAPVNLLVVLVRRPCRLVLLRLVVERFVRDTEDLRGLAAVAVGHVEGLFDDQALDLFHRLAEGYGGGVARASRARAGGAG